MVCWTEKDQSNIYKAATRAKKKTKQNKNDKKKEIITKYTCQEMIEEGHSIERVWYSTSREPSPDLNHAPKRVACTTLRTLRVSFFSNSAVDVA